MDTTVSGAKTVTIDNGAGRTTLDGTRVSGGSVDVTAGNLDITSAQNTASYLSTNESAGLSFAVPVYGTGGQMGFTVNASGGELRDAYASTEVSGLSGIDAGNGGVNIAVAGNTNLDAGVIASTAGAALNSLTTGSLTASGEKNASDYAGASASFSFGNLTGGGKTGRIDKVSQTKGFADGGTFGGSAAAVASSHETESQSVIGSNITVDAGTTSGTLSRDATTANQAIANDFNASKESNILALANAAETVAQKAAWTAYNGYKQVHGSKKSGTTVAHDVLGGAAGSSKSSAMQLPVK